MPKQDKPIYTVKLLDAARLAGVGRWAAYRAAKTGELLPGVPVVAVGRRLVVPVAPLARALGVEAEELCESIRGSTK